MKKKGFTLIELLVVIAIIGIMTSILLVILSDDKERRSVRISAQGFAAGIREAQNRALTGTKIGSWRPCEFQLYASASGYAVSTRAYDTLSDTASSCAAGTSDVSVSSDSFEKGVKLMNSDSVTVPHTTSFNVPFGNVVAGFPVNHSDPSLEFTLASQDELIQYKVCLYRSGRVESLGFTTSASCP